MDVITLTNPGDLTWEGFEQLGHVVVYDRTPTDDEAEIARRIEGASVVITNKTSLSATTINNSPQLKYIGVLATGYNVVDTAAAKAKQIPVCNIPTYGTTAVAQMVFALLLEICHHVGDHSHAVKKGDWTNNPDWCFWNYPLIELANKTMGIIGFGRIGQNTAKIAKAFGIKVLAFDEHPSAEGKALADYVSLDDLLANADVISLHCPLFPTTEGIINQANIAKMKQGVILVNTSRGQLVVEHDLAAALAAGKVYFAGLDVVSSEPIKKDNPLLTAPNCFITPHIAWAPKESRARLMDIAVANLKAFIEGTPTHVVNP